MRNESSRRTGWMQRLFLLSLWGAGWTPALGQPATLRFDRSVYTLSERTRDLTLVLVASAPACPLGFDIPETSAIVRAEPSGSARSGRDFTPIATTIPLGGSRTSFPLVLPGLVLDDAVVEGQESFRLSLTLQAPAGAPRVRCRSSAMLPLLLSGPPATVEIEDDGEAGQIPSSSSNLLLRCVACRVSVTQGSLQDTRMRAALFSLDGQPVARKDVPVFWHSADDRLSLREKVTSTDSDGVAVVDAVLGERLGTAVVTASLARGAPTTFQVEIVAATPARDGGPVAGTDLCGHRERLPPAVRDLCPVDGSPSPPDRVREIVPDEVAAQGVLGVEALALVGRAVRQRLEAWQKREEPELAKSPGASSRRNGLFVGAGSSSGGRATSAREVGSDFRLRSLQVGFDATSPEGELLFGGQLGYVRGDADFSESGGALEFRSLSATAFGAYRNLRETLHLEGFVTLELPRYKLARKLGLGAEGWVARSSASGTQWELSLGARTERRLGAFTLEGRTYLHWDEIAIDGFCESGAGDFDLAVAPRRIRSIVAEAGGRLRAKKAFAHWGIAVRLGADAIHELTGGARTLIWSFVQGMESKQRFATVTDPTDRDYFDLEAELIADLPGPWQGFLRVRKEIQRDDLKSRSLLVGLLVGL